MFKNTASQKLTILAFADAGHASLDAGEIVTGDSANITLKVEQDDDGTQSASNDTNPTEVEDGQYRFDLTQAETNGDKLTFYPESSTAGVQVVALPSNVIYTRPPNFPALGIESDGDLTQVNSLNGHTAQTADHTAAIAALPSQSDITGGAYSLDTDSNGRQRIVDGTGVGELDTNSGLIAGIAGTITTFDALDTAQDTQHSTTQSAISALNDLSASDVNAEVDSAIETYHLDHLFAVDYDPASKPGTATALLNELVEDDSGVSRFTVNALENGPSGSGASAAAIADAVWDEDIEAAHGTDATAGLLLRVLGAAISNRSNNATLNALLGIADSSGVSMESRINDVETDTADIQSRIPAALVAGRMDSDPSNMQASVVNSIRDAITGYSGALDTDSNGRVRIVDGTGTGEIDTNSGSVSANVTQWAGGTITSVLIHPTHGTTPYVALPTATQASIEAIEADTDELQTDWADGGRLDAILDARASQASVDGLNDVSTADINAQVLDVLNVDTLVAGKTIADALEIIGAVVAGVIANAGEDTEVFADFEGNTKVTLSVNSDGDRTSAIYAAI